MSLSPAVLLFVPPAHSSLRSFVLFLKTIHRAASPHLDLPLLSCPVLSCPVLSRPVPPCPVPSLFIPFCPAPSRPVPSCPVPSCPVLSGPVPSCPVLTYTGPTSRCCKRDAGGRRQHQLCVHCRGAGGRAVRQAGSALCSLRRRVMAAQSGVCFCVWWWGGGRGGGF